MSILSKKKSIQQSNQDLRKLAAAYRFWHKIGTETDMLPCFSQLYLSSIMKICFGKLHYWFELVTFNILKKCRQSLSFFLYEYFYHKNIFIHLLYQFIHYI